MTVINRPSGVTTQYVHTSITGNELNQVQLAIEKKDRWKGMGNDVAAAS